MAVEYHLQDLIRVKDGEDFQNQEDAYCQVIRQVQKALDDSSFLHHEQDLQVFLLDLSTHHPPDML